MLQSFPPEMTHVAPVEHKEGQQISVDGWAISYNLLWGRPNGLVRVFQDGHLRAEISYRDGVPHGTARAYHSNGQLAARLSFAQGIATGAFLLCDAQGAPTGYGRLHRGRPVGAWQIRDRTPHLSGRLSAQLAPTDWFSRLPRSIHVAIEQLINIDVMHRNPRAA